MLPPGDALPGTSPPPAAVGLPGGAVREFLVAHYGELAQLSGDWPGTPVAGSGLGDAAASREVCTRAPVGSEDAPAELLAVCGVPDGAGHATAAITDFFLLRAAGDGADGNGAAGRGVIAKARAHQQTFGSLGAVSGIEVRRLGARRHGFLVESGFTGQGITIGTYSLVVPRGDGFHEAAWLRSSIDNAGMLADCPGADDCDGDATFDVAYDLAIDDSRPDADAYALLVREHGDLCGRRVDTVHRLAFDAATGTWAVPAALQREGCP
ncbi:hypothetical protein LDO26_14190 [Luteimonas sp. BDR2-5]|uniref:hypothetical protein n=1 Tax=Proluteimonas luteida TaxID=2878685 RepID=UPI001E57504E|nr:hypothetical protein [Luteimonas sp. BDR2-5]MCD9029347.1 hypothetical protein [Luteimonas sp. BDR2-5]